MNNDRIESMAMNALDPVENTRALKKELMNTTPPAKRRIRLPRLAPGIGWIAGIGCIALMSGCATGPDYKRPTMESPAQFRNVPDAVSTNSFADLPWWDVYKDETLKALIYTALTNNLDVRIAAARVEQARALSAQARSQYMPSVGYAGGVSRGRNEFLGTPNPNGGDTGDAALATLSAAWEIDLWGRIRRLNESAQARYLATEEARRGVMISLVSELAFAYIELLELDLQLQIAQRTTDSFTETLRLFNDRLEGGIASRLDISRAQGALATTAARVPEVERLISIKENQINVLLGRTPGPVERSSTLLGQSMPPEVPAGLPSALLERRPDIRAAEQNLRSANAQVGVATADFFPRIGLTALLGSVSPEVSDLTAGSASMWSFAANATGPLFQGGALRAQKRQAVAFWEQVKLEYEQRVLAAFQEVSDALVSREKYALSLVQFEQAVTSYQEAVTISMQRYLSGNASYFEVLEAQQLLFPSEISLARAEANQLLVIIQLYRSLGGGWNLDDPTSAVEQQAPPESTPVKRR